MADNEKLVWVDIGPWSTVVVCQMCPRQWSASSPEEGYAMAKTHRISHIAERQEKAIKETCQEEGCEKPAKYKRYGSQCPSHYQRSRREALDEPAQQ